MKRRTWKGEMKNEAKYKRAIIWDECRINNSEGKQNTANEKQKNLKQKERKNSQ